MIAIAVGAMAFALLLGRIHTGRAAAEREAFQDALRRVKAGERGLRLDPSSSGVSPRLASRFNALIGAIEGQSLQARDVLFRISGSEPSDVLRAGERLIEEGHAVWRPYMAVVEIERFASLRRRIGTPLAGRLLAELTNRIRHAVPRVEIGRVGRTTFEFIFRAPTPAQAEVIMTRCLEMLEQPLMLDGFSFSLDVLIAAVDTSVCASSDQLADQLSAALADGREARRKVWLADENVILQEGIPEELTLMRDLQDALQRNELALFYQPKLRSRTNLVDSAEGLLRWTHPERGPVSTEKLIRLAEESGAIHPLTEWVIARAVTDQRRLAELGHDVTLYVNISGVLLPDRHFAARALAAVAGAPGKIGFEITETAVIGDPEGALENLRAFSAAGIKIAIDDYGSGLSSLAYLKQLPAHELKIDRMFVSGLTDSHRDPLLVRSSIDLAHALEMEVTAEGVDDVMSLSLLRVMGCDLIQGYLISVPLPFDDLVAFLDAPQERARLDASVSFENGWGSAAAS